MVGFKFCRHAPTSFNRALGCWLQEPVPAPQVLSEQEVRLLKKLIDFLKSGGL